MRKFNIELNKAKLYHKELQLEQLKAQVTTLQAKLTEVNSRVSEKQSEVSELIETIQTHESIQTLPASS